MLRRTLDEMIHGPGGEEGCDYCERFHPELGQNGVKAVLDRELHRHVHEVKAE